MPPVAAAAVCAAGTLRRATRSVARLYDAHLARAGLTTTQFSLLQALARRGDPVPLAELAQEQAFERTSLYRALEPLRREGLIAFSAGRGRSKEASLTPRGIRKVAEALPRWQEAQEAFLLEFGRSAWTALAKQLTTIVDVMKGVDPVRVGSWRRS